MEPPLQGGTVWDLPYRHTLKTLPSAFFEMRSVNMCVCLYICVYVRACVCVLALSIFCINTSQNLVQSGRSL